MTSAGRRSALDVLILAKRALQNGDRQSAYQLARQAALLDSALEEAWLILAALSANPDTSLQFLQRAIRINPASQRARRGIHWALQRKRKVDQMYFYKGYAMHGTYWHSNFGTPISHGCVNLRTEDAAWLYEWVSVGTPVSVHY